MVKSKPINVYIEYMGCPNRGMDAARFERYFLLNGCAVVKKPRTADYILYVSCAFLKEREDRAIARIRKLNKYPGQLIVAGCLKGINRQRLDENFKGESLVTASHDDIDRIFPQFRILFGDVSDVNTVFRVSAWRFLKENFFIIRFDVNFIRRAIFYFQRKFSREYCHLRICWGCEQEHCRFCVIWRAIGPLRSKPVANCVAELKAALDRGARKIILLSNNSGAYGKDSNSSLPELLEAIIAVEGDFSIEIEDMHPFWLICYVDVLVPLLRSGKITALHCPVQSGSDRMLEFMNRRHTVAQLKDACRKLRASWPALQINTHILVGFASETEDEFKQTLSFLRDIRPYVVQIYGYSNHRHIKDREVLDNMLSETVIRDRIRRAIKFCKENRIVCANA